MEDYRSELTAVTSELSSVEQQLDELLQRQNDLMRRKDELEAILTRNSADSSKVDHNWNKTDFSWSEKLQETLKSVFNIKDLRPMQLQTMNVTMSGRDCILIMPTGGGKSLCFQLPAVLSKGITLVVSPLVALMEDQVMSVNSYHIDAAMLNADCSKEKVKKIQDDMIDHNATLKLLYVTPEKLSKSKRFMARLEKMYKVGKFSRLVIDEVHCCSQWGHDFRPDYKFLGIMKRQFPDVPILGLTATATTSVLDDVKKILDIQSCELFRASFNRPNLFYEVREKSSVQKDVVCDMEKLIKTKFHNKSGIIYTFSKKECEEVASSLQSLGIKAGCYHADLTANERSKVHRAWLENSVHVVVATIAFGMGIDKPDVRFVIHHSISKSMENLYQESGRAGRDGARSHCIVYYRFQDVFRQSAMVMAEQTGLNNLYGILSYCIDISRCRRCVIARYFGEVWEPSQCNRMCDVCNADYASGKMDITTLCINALKILEQAVTIDNKLTAIKLLDAWQGKGPTVNRVKGTSTDKSKEVLEGYLALMLTKQFIREDFHFTPYSTISYLVPGPKANLIRNGSQKILINVKQKKKVEPSELQKSSTKSLDYSSSPSSTNVKVIKDKTRTPGQNSDKVQMKSPKADVKESKRLFQPKKRRIIESSDSDLSDLDLGDSVPCKKKSKISCAATENNRIKNVREESRSISTGNMPVKASSSSKRAIVIDSD